MEDVENENDCKRPKDRSPSPAIKSTAVVKYTAFQSPVSYSRLQCNTDLNLPPSNWGGAIDSYGLKQILTTGTGLSSFRMAHMFPDCVADVDVIAGAEVIKRLLKLPYQPNGTVSMMVHRVENTLLLDDFDVYDYLMKSEWSWLKDFFYENILKTMSEQERSRLSMGGSSTALLTAHFLSRSAPAAELQYTAPPLPTLPTPHQGPFLPEPETKSEGPPDVHLYNRNVLWTFEDIHMLIGSDLPIFGDKDRPCVSLRLRDAKEPINVLTGIDYWLDNLMCNVPEVLMCYHLDGIVQKYEPMKTEDLPNMENSKFSPKVIRNVAQNILSFLKSNATKAGHTYWLFKGPHDDVVKLYDLTSLCPDTLDNPFTTPVAMLLYRVARNMRLTNRTRHVKQLLEHVIELLEVERYPQIVASSHYMLADMYIPATTNPACPNFQEESSDSDAEDTDYTIPTEVIDPCERDSTTQQTEECEGESEKDSEWDGSKDLAVQIRGLALSNIGDRVKPNNKTSGSSSSHAGWSRDPVSRCGRALRHARRGLLALTHIHTQYQQDDERERLKQQIINEEQNPKMANPYEPIKMEYEPLKRKQEPKEHISRSRRRKNRKSTSDKNAVTENIDKNAIQIRKENNTFPSLHEPNRDDNFAWKLHLKTLLYEKICLAYATLAEYSYSHEQYGFSLKYIDMATKCQKLLSNMIIKSKVVDASCLIGRVGDNYFQLSKNWQRLDTYKKQFETDHEIDGSLRQAIENDMIEEMDGVSSVEFDLDISMPTDQTTAMVWSCAHYKAALQHKQNKTAELQRRLASVTNELHVAYMQQAQQTYLQYIDQEDTKSETSKQLLDKFNALSALSEESLDESTRIFQEVNDVPNLALLYCNKGRFLRFKAHCAFDQNGFTVEKRHLYEEAEELYQQALRLLAGRGGKQTQDNPGDNGAVQQLVRWELSCHAYTAAVHMQDQPGDTLEVSEVAESLKHALKFCLLSPGPRQYLYQFRAAMIYHRLGSLYHAQYRQTTEDGPKRRTVFNLTRNNYELASNLLATLEDAAMFLTVQLEHVAVLESHAQVTPNLKLKSLQTAVQLLRQCHSIMKLISEKDPEEQETRTTEEMDEKLIKNEYSLLSLYENRLHHILKSIIQYCRSKSNKDYEKMTDVYKKLYCASLKIKKHDDIRKYALSVCEVLTAMDEISRGLE